MGIYVWGTGCGASELLEQGLELEQISAFVDSYPSGSRFLGKEVLLPEDLPVADCSLLLVTTRHTQAVAQRCQELGLPLERVLFLKDSLLLQDRNQGCTVGEALLGRELLTRLLPKHRLIPQPMQLTHTQLPETALSGDYVRLAALELLCRRLSHVPGAAAELGVYQGFFAGCINRLLPERRLYLFDSFAGFSPSDEAHPAFQSAHEHTSVDRVLSSLPHPEQAVILSGYFPHSLKGLEERFCLVSLDVDFGDATLAGLRYFWPRLHPGGYLLLHDWGNPRLPEVAQALESYQMELGAVLPGVPLADRAGTLVLCKAEF